MLQRPTQTAAFWRDQFEVTPTDLDFLYNLIVDAQAPRTAEQLALALIEEYIRRENSRIESELAKGAIYLPRNRYAIGQTLVFPALNFAIGEVVGLRPGQNPEHGEFEVIKVKLPGSSPREFAANLHTGHRLNQSSGANMLQDEALLSAEEIYSLYQDEINESLLYALEEGDRSRDFVTVDGNWLIADMLAEVHIGHLNIAEALIEMQGQPLTIDQFLAEVELDANVSPSLQRISLEHALSRDERFDPVRRNREPQWYLTRLEPAEVVRVPFGLRYTPMAYNRALLSVELLQTEWEIDDEWGESTLSSELPAIVPSTTLTLIYPHWRNGTLPINGRTRSFFPSGVSGKSLVTFLDGRWGATYTGWVIHENRYVTGLAKWMEDHAIPVGAFITLERTRNEGELVVDFRTRRPKREWARMATADLEHSRLLFEMNKIQVACEYDEALIAATENVQVVDRLAEQLAGTDLRQIVDQIVPELTKLNPQGTAHAKSVYSAVNIVRRCPPGPIFHALLSNRRFRDAGGGVFALA